ncbi:MAG: PAS domain S-box protein [Chloroflexi bacterium]|nr:PAS domain S-box protein [Chloroflexota bacterium]MCC6891485.1 PAS domain S-box protein [Anaerolineae bacterium]
MFNPLLEHHLAELGIEPESAPTAEQWQKLLTKISDIYTDYQSAELDLRQSEMLYEDLYNSTWRQTQELSLLVRVREALANKLQFNDVIRTVVEATAEAFGYALVTIYLLKEDVLHLQHQVGYEKTIAQMPITQGVMGHVARTGEPAFVEDCRLDADFIGAIDGLVSEVCVPIRNRQQVIGVLNVETRAPQRLTSNDLDLMSSLSEHIGLALERAELYSAVQESNQKYHMVVDNINEVIFQVDVNGYLTFLNPAWYKLSGHTVESSLGKHFANFIVPGAIDALTQMQQLLTSSQRSEARFQSLLLRPDGSGVPVEARIQRTYTPDGQFMGLGGTAFDISDRLQAEQHAREAQLMARVQEAISSKLGLKDMIRSIVEVTAETFGYELVSAYLVEGDNLHLQHQVGYDTIIPKFPITKGVAGRVVRTQKAVLVENAADDPDFLFAFPGISSEICVPLINDGQAVGVMIVEAREGKTLTQNDLRVLIILSEHLSVAVERARLYTAVQESNQRYQMVVDNVHEVIFQLDPHGIISFLNHSWMELSGYALEESIGKHFSSFMPPEDTNKAEALGELLYAGEQEDVRYQHSLVRIDGTLVPLEVRMQLVHSPDGEIVGIGGTAIDIRERLQAEQQALNLLLQTRTVEMLRSFLSNVSHDLRTPLSIMNTSLYLLRRKMGDDANGNRYLEALDKQTEHMQHIIEDMLDISKLDDENTQLNLMRVDINGLINDLLVTLNAAAVAKGQQLTFVPATDHSIILSDQTMLGKAIANVIKNAIQYTLEGGKINITTTNGTASLFTIRVRDSGIGINATTLPHIFDRFYKADTARPTNQGGMGLGLTIARKIIELHGGTISAISNVGEGSTFTITLPMDRN